MTKMTWLILLIGSVLRAFTVAPAEAAQLPPIDQAGANIQQMGAEIFLERIDGCYLTQLYVSAGSNVIAGFPYTSGHFGDFGAEAGDHFAGAGAFLYVFDNCMQGELVKTWGTVSWSGSISYSRHHYSATGIASVLECIEPAGICDLRAVPLDLTWIIEPPAFEQSVDTTNDIHGSGVISNQGGATTSADISGTVDGEPIDTWTIVLVQVNTGHQTGLVHRPVP